MSLTNAATTAACTKHTPELIEQLRDLGVEMSP